MKKPLPDVVNKKFGKLTILKIERNKKSILIADCVCECGNLKTIDYQNLKEGVTKSCGCLKYKTGPENSSYKHGMSRTNTNLSWRSMNARCNDPKTSRYKRYGGRGITICERWKKFENFLEDMGERPDGTQLDRIDNDGNYYKENCRWATPKQQSRNRISNHTFEYKGKRITLIELSEISGYKPDTIRRRILEKGMTVEEAVNTPRFKRIKKN